MPELPEVETIRLGLQQKIIGLSLKSIEILNPKTFQGNENSVLGLEVKNTWRAAKMLGIDLQNPSLQAMRDASKKLVPLRDGNLKSSGREIDSEQAPRNDISLLFHLKMSGQMIYIDGKSILAGGHPTLDMKDKMPNKSTRVIFTFSDGSKLFFNDQRKFGWIKVMDTEKIIDDSFYKGLGPEPLAPEFTVQLMKERLTKHRNWPVKAAIMDQSTISGIGNIYAAEACFDAKLDPRTKISELSDTDFQLLHRGIIRSLSEGIKYGGSSRANFVNSEGEKGLFLDYAYVYNRKDKPCKKCKTPIEKIELAGRGTYFCPKCQKLVHSHA